MEELKVCGQVVGGGIARIGLRQKSGDEIELGDLLVIDGEEGGYVILRVYDLAYGSQVSPSSREMLAGMRLEGYGAGLEFMEPELRNYVLAEAKPILQVTGDKEVSTPKVLPAFFSSVRRISERDLDFLTKPNNPVYMGKVRSGTKILDVDIHLNGEDAFSHHILVPAITGRGKSNLVKVMLWSVLEQERFGVLVLDPHDEYYGRHGKGLKDHPRSRDRLLYYSPTPVTGTNTLVINLRSIHPSHFDGIVEFSEAQQDAINLYYNNFQEDWIENIVRGAEVGGVSSRTLAVIQRKFDIILGVYVDAMDRLQCRNRVFSNRAGEATVGNIIDALEEGETVILDTSRLIDEAELLIGSIVVGAVFNNYQRSKARGELGGKPNVSVVIEEAPRVLGQDVLATKGKNIYSTIAREGRKFKVGLIAITQLTSMIPRIILTNMNTKIVLGNEMALERRAIIECAAQDLSDDDRTIASLDTGEALVTSNFTNFAVPIQIPLFEDYIAEQQEEEEEEEEMAFEGVDIQ